MTSFYPPRLPRKNILVRALSGDRFMLNLGSMSDSVMCEKFIKAIRSREHVMRDGVSCRVVNHWESQGLLECERNNESGWRKFQSHRIRLVSHRAKVTRIWCATNKNRKSQTVLF